MKNGCTHASMSLKSHMWMNELHLMEQECVWTFLMLFMLSFSAGPTPALNDIWM